MNTKKIAPKNDNHKALKALNEMTDVVLENVIN